MSLTEALGTAAGAVTAVQIAIFRQDQAWLVVAALALFAVLGVATFRDPVARVRRN